MGYAEVRNEPKVDFGKMTEEYELRYGEVPKNFSERLDFVLAQCCGKRGIGVNIGAAIERIRKIKWHSISFTIYVVPKGTPRPRLGHGNHFYVKGASDNKKFFKEFYKELDEQPKICTACKISCNSYLPIPSTMKRYEMVLAELGYIRPLVKPDFDNLVKTYTDMIQGTMLEDDAYVIEGTSRKFYSVKPRVELTVSYMEEFDSDFNKKKVKGDND
jgi:Holliday junction resolvase RusA-like endonuclease